MRLRVELRLSYGPVRSRGCSRFRPFEGQCGTCQKKYPDLTFLCADACDPALDLSLASWDLVVSFEVLEHVPRMDTFLRNVRSHLAAGGIAFITTPNRAVFSLGYEPSPVNREHMKELSREEFESLLRPFFSQIEIWGQGFKRKELLDAWKIDVQEKIIQCRVGTRWQASPPLREKLRRIALVDKAYRNPVLQKSWKYLRWTVLQQFENKRAIRRRPYSFADFEFSGDTSNALWFCALVKP